MYSIAVNQYVRAYDNSKPSKYIAYLDANILCGWALSENFPRDSFKWVDYSELKHLDGDVTNHPADSKLGYILEFDHEYLEELHRNHNEHPTTPERLIVQKSERLYTNIVLAKTFNRRLRS